MLEDDWKPMLLDDVCELHIKRVMEMCNNNRLQAAQILGIGRSSLYRHFKRKRMETATLHISKGAVA
jgi:DNA-binding protein Fis